MGPAILVEQKPHFQINVIEKFYLWGQDISPNGVKAFSDHTLESIGFILLRGSDVLVVCIKLLEMLIKPHY